MNTLLNEKKLEPEDLMKLWYDENLKYDYNDPKESEPIPNPQSPSPNEN